MSLLRSIAALIAIGVFWNPGAGAASYMNAALPKKKAAPQHQPIAVVGTGNMGSAISELFCRSGVPVLVTSRSVQKAQQKVRSIKARASSCDIKAVSNADAIAQAGVVIVTAPFSGMKSWLTSNRESIVANTDIVIVDITNSWRSGDGIAADAPLLSAVEIHKAALGNEKTSFVAGFKNNFAMKNLQHASGKNIVEFAADSQLARDRFEQLVRATKFRPAFRGFFSEGAAATLEAEVRRGHGVVCTDIAHSACRCMLTLFFAKLLTAGWSLSPGSSVKAQGVLEFCETPLCERTLNVRY